VIKHSKYYYDYTRNMSIEQIKKHCGRPNCIKENCLCEPGPSLDSWRASIKKEIESIGFDAWIEDMEESEQPACNMDNPEDCENCGS
jgi:hypothetical protein